MRCEVIRKRMHISLTFVCSSSLDISASSISLSLWGITMHSVKPNSRTQKHEQRTYANTHQVGSDSLKLNFCLSYGKLSPYICLQEMISKIRFLSSKDNLGDPKYQESRNITPEAFIHEASLHQEMQFIG
jgi:hypothetical protein